MIMRIRHRLLQRLQLRESWVIFFIMGIIMLNFPFLHIFNKSDTLFGFPLLFIYFTIGWAVSIFVIYLFTLAVKQNNAPQHGNKEP
jgi:membrane-anchored protein YejM (alkaline phosphatase superfamily)